MGGLGSIRVQQHAGVWLGSPLLFVCVMSKLAGLKKGDRYNADHVVIVFRLPHSAGLTSELT